MVYSIDYIHDQHYGIIPPLLASDVVERRCFSRMDSDWTWGISGLGSVFSFGHVLFLKVWGRDLYAILEWRPMPMPVL